MATAIARLLFAGNGGEETRQNEPEYSLSLEFTILCAVVISAAIYLVLNGRISPFRKKGCFPLMKLPPEIRLHVYEHLISMDSNSRSAPQSNKRSTQTAQSPGPVRTTPPMRSIRSQYTSRSSKPLLLPREWTDFLSLTKPRPWRPYTALPLVSRQIRDEFTQMMCLQATFEFILDENAAKDAAKAAEAASYVKLGKDEKVQSEKVSNFTICSDTALWNLSQQILSRMRTCRILIKANPALILPPSSDLPADQHRPAFVPQHGRFDPAAATSGIPWHLRDRTLKTIESMPRLQELTLSIQAATGDQLWNPMSLWHYTSQAFKRSKVPAFKRMSFDLEGWSMTSEPNHLERCLPEEGEDSGWEWRCSKGHYLRKDSEGNLPIREFCEALFRCRECDPGDNED